MCIEPMTLARRATDKGEPTNREILDRLDEFMQEHRRDHKTLETRLADHDTAAALRESKIVSLERLTPEVAALHDFRVQARTIADMTRWILGGSLLAAISSVISLGILLAHLAQGS